MKISCLGATGLLLGMCFCTCRMAAAEEVFIENTSDYSFFYSLRSKPREPWTESIELAPKRRATHQVTGRVQISYLTDQGRFAWLEANKTYRIADVEQGALRAVTEVRRPVVPDREAPPARVPGAEGEARESVPQADPSAEPAASDTAAAPKATTKPSIPGPAADTQRDTAPPVVSTPDGSQPASREIAVIAIADETYRNSVPDWRDRMTRVIAGVSAYYDREFALRLKVLRTQKWEYSALTDAPEKRWQRLLSESPGDAELVVAFVGFGDFYRAEAGTTYTNVLGRGAFFGQHVVVADQPDVHVNRAKTVLIHELGHNFGAFHVDEPQTVMNRGYSSLPSQDIIDGTVTFGEGPSNVLRITRHFDFRRGVASLTPAAQRELQVLYRHHGLGNEQASTDPITQGFKYLQLRAEIDARKLGEQAEQSRVAFGALTQ